MDNLNKVVRAVFILCLGGLFVGFNIVVIAKFIVFSNSTQSYLPAINWLLIISAFSGLLLGAILSIISKNKLSQKSILIFASIVIVFAEISIVSWNNTNVFMLAKIIGSIGMGLILVSSPLYINDIAPNRLKSFFTTSYYLNIAAGIVLALLFLRIFENKHETASLNNLSHIPMSLSVLFCILVHTIYNSPKWLLKKGDELRARFALLRLGYNDIDKEIKNIQIALSSNKKSL